VPEPNLPQSTDVQLLGELQTEVVGTSDNDLAVQPGEQVNLERETENAHDTNAIRVENRHFQPIGHLSNDVASWLAPLIDAGNVRLDGYVPRGNRGGKQPTPHTSQLTLAVFLTGKGLNLLEKTDPRNRQEALHQVVLHVYRGVHDYSDPRLVLEVAEGLRPLEEQELLPETRLLLALLPGIARELQAAHGMQAVAKLHSGLANLIIGESVHHHNLTLFPLLWPNPQDPPYMLLQQAIEAGEAAVEEVSEAGSVPNLLLNNKGQRPVLIPEGDILMGAKQNRMVNVTVLVAPLTKFTVPVSCVEQGRWRYSSKYFATCACAPPSLRSKKTRSVQRNRAMSGIPASDQGEVWDEVARNLHDIKVHSATASLTDGFAAAEDKLENYRRQLKLPEQAAGVLVASGDRVLGMDLFDSPKTFSAVWKRLSDAYFFDAVRNGQQQQPADRELARRFLAHVDQRARPRIPSLGLGEELEIAGNCLVGAALLYGGAICHLAAFSERP
jgi:hypothetical protein